ncbi:MAG: P-type ATPase, partial [Amphiamblys sp. WSBS2006]
MHREKEKKKFIELERDIFVYLTPVVVPRKRKATYIAASILSCGLLPLLSFWDRRLRLLWITEKCSFAAATHLITRLDFLKEYSLVQMETKTFPFSLRPFFTHSDSYLMHMDGEKEEKEELRTLKFFAYKETIFVYNPVTNQISKASEYTPTCHSVLNRTECLGDQEALLETVFGRNEIQFKRKSAFVFFLRQLFHPFTVFQIAAICLWFYLKYNEYAVGVLVITSVSIATSILSYSRAQAELERTTRMRTTANISRGGMWEEVDSVELVPGDMIKLVASTRDIPADAVLLEGNIVVCESLVTGETVSVLKRPAPSSIEGFDVSDPDNKDHFLFMGTSLAGIQDSRGYAIGVVVRTGKNTLKGNISLSFILPGRTARVLERDTRKIFLCCLAVGVGYMFFGYFLLSKAENENEPLANALDLLTIFVPPALPSVFGASNSSSVSLLSSNKIISQHPENLDVFGVVDMVCFDKTGTLTEVALKTNIVVEYTGAWREVTPQEAMPHI